MALATPNVTATAMELMVFGKMCLKTISQSDTPIERAARTNCCSRSVRNWPRTSRAIEGQVNRPMTSMALYTLGPIAEATVMMMTSDGKVINISVSRIRSMSTLPPLYPAMLPMMIPMNIEIETDTRPTDREMRPAKKMRESTSRPVPSVPNQCRAVGGLRIARRSSAIGEYGVSKGAAIDTKISRHRTISPNIASLWRKNRLRALPHKLSGLAVTSVMVCAAVVIPNSYSYRMRGSTHEYVMSVNKLAMSTTKADIST